MVDSHLEDWDTQSRYVVHAYNATEHASTGCTPNMLVLGEEIIMPSDMVYGVQGLALEQPCAVMFVEALRRTLRESYALVRGELEKHANLQKIGYDTGLKDRRFKVGDLVARYSTPQSKVKILYDWEGPFEVVTVVSETTVVIRSTKGKLYKSHVARLKPWLGVTVDVEQLHRGTKQQRAVVTVPTPGRRVSIVAARRRSVRPNSKGGSVKTTTAPGVPRGTTKDMNKQRVGRPPVRLPTTKGGRKPAHVVSRGAVDLERALTATQTSAQPTRRSKRILDRRKV